MDIFITIILFIGLTIAGYFVGKKVIPDDILDNSIFEAVMLIIYGIIIISIILGAAFLLGYGLFSLVISL